ncbi:DgyrCDS7656 [Dimorphilus gyrociliatus]|uniref:DgyrCDS7656 n=1 Tax=Dimorphilus gyrociliatus TaxID=2664684 RepID=A0A7I8VRV3_9ANNE|nr:DgyrCDS7656 [Dimorphilus gyrociliatus]
MTSESNKDRLNALGFEPQRENPYCKILPYSDVIDKESNENLSEIKANIGRAVQLGDSIGLGHWMVQLKTYIRLYGFKFSKEDHIKFINLFYEAILIDDLNLSMVQRISRILTTLLAKKTLLTREDLVLEWRPLFKLMYKVYESKMEGHGLLLQPDNIKATLKSLIVNARLYFPSNCTQELLDECRPYLCMFDVKMTTALFLLDLFLPVNLPPNYHDQGFKIWFEEFMEFYLTLRAEIRYEKIFTRTLGSFQLPLADKTYTGSSRVDRASDVNMTSRTCLRNLLSPKKGNGSSTLEHIRKIFVALQSFYHPSNNGKWSDKLLLFINKLAVNMVDRVHRERYKKSDWTMYTKESAKLTDEEITEFVNILKPIVLQAIFSKFGIIETTGCLQHLAKLRPEIVIPPLIDMTYEALTNLNEPHRLIPLMKAVGQVSGSMLSYPKHYPEGPTHVLRLLNMCIPGIDPNDLKKTITTMQMVSTLCCLVPIVDCSKALETRTDLTETEKEVCRLTMEFEDFVLQFMDRIFLLIENSVQEHGRTDAALGNDDKMSADETIIEMGLASTFIVIVQQCSLPIYKLVLDKLFNFVSNNCFEINVAGRYAADLCRAVSEIQPELVLNKFFNHCARIIKQHVQNDNFAQEEGTDSTLLWNLRILSECLAVRELSSNLLLELLKALTRIYTNDFRSTPEDWNQPIEDYLPIRDWGKPGDLNNLKLVWHIPSEEEKETVVEVLKLFLLPQLAKIDKHVSQKSILEREELLQTVNIISKCISGAGTCLDMWEDEKITGYVTTRVEMKSLQCSCTTSSQSILLDGENPRLLIYKSIRPLIAHLLSSQNNEDDTKTVLTCLNVMNDLMSHMGKKDDQYLAYWKSWKTVKNILQNKLLGKKAHARAVLAQRAQLQHELRVLHRSERVFTTMHKGLLDDIFKLSVSRYSSVRMRAQQHLYSIFKHFSYVYRLVVDDIIDCLKDNNDISHHQFKGALYCILGEREQSLIYKHNFKAIGKIWPALIEAQHSEKPSILKVIEKILNKLHKHVSTMPLGIYISDQARTAAEQFWVDKTQPHPSLENVSLAEISKGKMESQEQNDANRVSYEKLLNDIVERIQTKKLHWKFLQMALEMLSLLLRNDYRAPASVVQTFIDNSLHDVIYIRRISIDALQSILQQQKRKHLTMDIDPYQVANCKPPKSINYIIPGERPDNKWLLYDDSDVLVDEETYNNTIFVEKTHWGYYTWPKPFKVYQPPKEQPSTNRAIDELKEEEKIIYQAFCNKEYVDKLCSLLTLEDSKNKEKFRSKYYFLFKGLFRNFGWSLYELFSDKIEAYVADSNPKTRYYSHRCAAEIICALMRGSKHWPYEQVKQMWARVIPLLRSALLNTSIEESKCIWGYCIATASESRDPRKLKPLFDFLIDNPISGESGSSVDVTRLYCLQGALQQQEWRIPFLLNKLLDHFKKQLAYNYKNVRDRMASCLQSIFFNDIRFKNSPENNQPKVEEFVNFILPHMKRLVKETEEKDDSEESESTSNLKPIQNEPKPMNIDREAIPMEKIKSSANGIVEKKDEVILLSKTVLHWIDVTIVTNLKLDIEKYYPLIPFINALQNYTDDDELQEKCRLCISFMSIVEMYESTIEPFKSIINQICSTKSWKGRRHLLHFCETAVFNNLFFLFPKDDVRDIVRSTVIQCLSDIQLEVREKSAKVLCGFFHCGYIDITEDLIEQFIKLAKTSIKRKKTAQGTARLEPVAQEKIRKRHAGILALSACILASPYDVPTFVPDILMEVSKHADDPQPIQGTVKQTLTSFKRTHHDNWQDHKQRFSDDQINSLTELLVSPNYYA